jgi:hypothetical protein
MANIDELKKSGMNIEALPAEQQAALNKLDQNEIDALVKIREKLNEGDEVSGHALNAYERPVEEEGSVLPRLMDGNFVW